jgi:hypothetical protein
MRKGKCRSDFSEVLRRCLRRGAPGRAMLKRLIPALADYIVLKPEAFRFLCDTAGSPTGTHRHKHRYSRGSDDQCMRDDYRE